MVTKRNIGWLEYSLDFTLVFLFIYGVTFKFTGFAGSKLVIIFLLAILNKRRVLQQLLVNKFVKYTFIIWILISAHYYAVTVFSGQYSWVFLYQRFLFYFECVIGSFLVWFYLDRKYTLNQICMLLVKIFLLQSILIFLSFVSDGFREFTNKIMVVEDERALSATRTRGFSTSVNAALSYLQSLGVWISIIYFCVFKKEERGKLSTIICLSAIIIITLSTIFIARTGMIFCILFILSYLVQFAINNRSFFKTFFYSILLMSCVVVIATNYEVFIPQQKLALFRERVVNRAFEAIETYNESGKLETTSTNILSNMFFFPEHDVDLIFGEGIWDASKVGRGGKSRVVRSDVGFVRLIFAGGIIMVVVFYSQIFVFLKQLLGTSLGKFYWTGIVCLGLVIIIGEFKEPFVIAASGIVKTFFLILFAFTLTDKKFKNQNIKQLAHAKND